MSNITLPEGIDKDELNQAMEDYLGETEGFEKYISDNAVHYEKVFEWFDKLRAQSYYIINHIPLVVFTNVAYYFDCEVQHIESDEELLAMLLSHAAEYGVDCTFVNPMEERPDVLTGLMEVFGIQENKLRSY